MQAKENTKVMRLVSYLDNYRMPNLYKGGVASCGLHVAVCFSALIFVSFGCSRSSVKPKGCFVEWVNVRYSAITNISIEPYCMEHNGLIGTETIDAKMFVTNRISIRAVWDEMGGGESWHGCILKAGGTGGFAYSRQMKITFYTDGSATEGVRCYSFLVEFSHSYPVAAYHPLIVATDGCYEVIDKGMYGSSELVAVLNDLMKTENVRWIKYFCQN